MMKPVVNIKGKTSVRLTMPLLLFLLCLASSLAWSQPAVIIGYAYDVSKGSLYYTEAYRNHYDLQGKLLSSDVVYQGPDKTTVLATKHLHYQKHPYAPEFTFSNHAVHYEESVSWLNGNTVLVRTKESGDQWRERRLEVAEPIVADAGFDVFLKDHMATLLAGKTLHFNFLNPARLDWFRFCAEAVEQSVSTVTLRVYPDNALLRWLVDPILLTYELPSTPRESPKLLHYSGLTNLSLTGSSPVEANIFYEYEQAKPQQIVKLF